MNNPTGLPKLDDGKKRETYKKLISSCGKTLKMEISKKTSLVIEKYIEDWFKMTIEKKLGKIEKVSFGLGAYQGSMLGLHVTISGSGWGVSTGKSAWDKNMIECSDRAEWTEEGRSREYDEIVRYISDLLLDAKVHEISLLAGMPVEATFDGNTIKDWRILTEVL